MPGRSWFWSFEPSQLTRPVTGLFEAKLVGIRARTCPVQELSPRTVLAKLPQRSAAGPRQAPRAGLG